MNDKDLSSGYSTLPPRSGIGLQRRPSVPIFHSERQGRLRPTSVEAHERQYKGKSGGVESPEELDADHL